MRLATIVLLLALCAGSSLAAGTITIHGEANSGGPQLLFHQTSSDPLTGLSGANSMSFDCGTSQASAASGGGFSVGSVRATHCGFGNFVGASVFTEYLVPFTLTSATNQSVAVSLNLVSRASTNNSGGTGCEHPAFTLTLGTTFGSGFLALTPDGIFRSDSIALPDPNGTPTQFSTPSIPISTNTPQELRIKILTTVNTGGASCEIAGSETLNFPTNGPVFNLPAGVTVNIPELNIVDNRWRDPRLGVAPSSVNFGSVNVGTKQFQIVTLTNQQTLANLPLTLESLSIDSPANGFSTLTAGLPVSVPAGGTFDIPVQFLPSAVGPVSNTLHVVTSVSAADVPLSGIGANSAPPSQQQITDTLNFFDSSVNAGTLAGSGLGSSGTNRRNALRNMIEAAGDLIQQNRIGEACTQLLDALNRTDGNPKPPDFVTGSAAPPLLQMLQSIRTSLGCQ